MFCRVFRNRISKVETWFWEEGPRGQPGKGLLGRPGQLYKCSQ